MEIKDLIKQRRQEKGYSLEDVAKLVGVSRQTVQKWETGKIENMRRSSVAALSSALDIPIEALIGWDTPEDGLFATTGARIRARREMLDMTQTDLGSAIGAHKSTIQRYEMGEVDRIKLPILDRLAKKLDVDPCWLALKTDSMGAYPASPISVADSLDPPITAAEVEAIKKYRTLNAYGKDIVDHVLDAPMYHKEPERIHFAARGGQSGTMSREEAEKIKAQPEIDDV